MTLSEACQIKPPKKEAKEKIADTEMVSFVPMKDLGICEKTIPLTENRTLRKVYSGYTYFADNDVLLAKITPCFENGKLGIAKGLTNQIGFGSSEYIVFRPTESIDSNYLFYFLSQETFREEGKHVMTGAVGHKRVPKEFIENYVIPLPPLPEQKQIVAILDKAFAGINQAIAHTEQNLANARELFESYLNTIFMQKQAGWVEKPLGEIGKVSMCKRVLKKQTSSSGDIPFYKIGTFGKKPNAFISKELYQDFKEKYSFPKKGDILISASGTIGRRVVYDGMPAYFQDSNIVWIDNNEKLVLNEYLYQFYGVCDWNPSKGATISRLYNNDLRKIKILYPSLSEQQKLIPKMLKFNDETQNLEAIYQQKLTALHELKQSLLQKAFAGELTR